jgi:hypothetical protein
MKTFILVMSLLNADGKVVAQGATDGMTFNSAAQCETYKKRMKYHNQIGTSTTLTFKCTAK